MSGSRVNVALRVLHLITDRNRRGAQVFALDLAAGLEHLGMSNEVLALSPGSADDSLEVEVLGPSRRSRTTMAELRRRGSDVDVVVAHGSATLFASALALAWSSTPFVYRQISDPLFWASRWSRRVRVAALIRRAAAVVALSSGAVEDLRAHYRLNDRRMHVIPNAVPAASFRAAGTGRHGDGATHLLYLGALAEEKGVDMAIRSVANLPDARLTVAGAGPERGRLERLAAELAEGRVTFAGSVPEAPPLLRKADLFVFPSRGGDSMPAVLIEAGLTGLASVTTPVGSITDIVVDGETGRVVPIGDQRAFDAAVAELVDSPHERGRLGDAARARCSELFTVERVAPRWLEVLTVAAGRQSHTDS